MGLKSFVNEKLSGLVINTIIGRVESGAYGESAKSVWFAVKGKKTLIGWLMFALGGAITLNPSPQAMALGSTLAIVGSYLGRFGLIAKGSDKTPPPFPEEYRGAMEFALSATTYIVELLTAGAGLAMLSGYEHATEASMTMMVVGQALSTASGYLSTLIGHPPNKDTQ